MDNIKILHLWKYILDFTENSFTWFEKMYSLLNRQALVTANLLLYKTNKSIIFKIMISVAMQSVNLPRTLLQEGQSSPIIECCFIKSGTII